MRTHPAIPALLLLLVLALPLAACDIDVRTEADAPDTGLPTYPGARLTDDEGRPESANVSVSMPFVDVEVAAATFESDDAPERIVEFYRTALRTHGEVTECHGDIDVRSNGPVCREDRGSGEVQLAAGTQAQHRLVVVKPRGAASEFALVYVRTRR